MLLENRYQLQFSKPFRFMIFEFVPKLMINLLKVDSDQQVLEYAHSLIKDGILGIVKLV